MIFSLLLGLGFINVVAAEGDIAAGQAKSAMCAACHGVNGRNESATYPDLAGQHGDYIAKQLKAFKDGSRGDPVMAPMAAGLSAQDMGDLGAFFASQSRSQEKATDAGTSAAAVHAPALMVADAGAGKGLYQYGDAPRGVYACVDCHGNEGNSEVLINPNLAKQHGQYIEKQLHNFKSGERKNAVMNLLAKEMTEQDIINLGAYLNDPEGVADVTARRPVVPLVLARDVAAGKAKATVCAACHGVNGNAMVPMYPKLAGQNASYIAKQLADFKAGADSGGTQGRVDAVMGPMAQNLSQQEMLELGSFFAAQKTTAGDTSEHSQGRKIYFGGDAKRGVTACVACHGVTGLGIEKAGFPSLAGQNKDYLTKQLVLFRKGDRSNDKNSMMRNIAKKLSKADMKSVVEYMASLK